jgi:hypothetical protein
MTKQIKYGDFFLDPHNKRKIRKMRSEVRRKLVKVYEKRADKKLPLFRDGYFEVENE